MGPVPGRTMVEPGQQGGIRVVAWDPTTDQRFLVSGTPSAYQVDFAAGLLRDGGS